MSISIDLYAYNHKSLVDDLIKIGCSDNILLDKILTTCGDVFGESCIILCNEHCDDGNPYYNIATLIDSAFNISDSFNVFFYNETKKEGINYVDIYEVAEELGIKLEE